MYPFASHYTWIANAAKTTPDALAPNIGKVQEALPIFVVCNRTSGDSLSLGPAKTADGTVRIALTQTLYSRDLVLSRSQFSNGDLLQIRRSPDGLTALEDENEGNHRELRGYSSSTGAWSDLGNAARPETWRVAIDDMYGSEPEIEDLRQLESHGFSSVSSLLDMVAPEEDQHPQMQNIKVKVILRSMFRRASDAVDIGPKYQKFRGKLHDEIIKLEKLDNAQALSTSDQIPVQPICRFSMVHP
jgi:hypothetical protein